MTIIVTGGAGFIGSNFVFYQLKNHPKDRIVCFDKLTYAGNLATLAPVMDNPNFRFVKGDIADRADVEKLFEEEHPDIVVNFAAESHVDRSIEDPGILVHRYLWMLAESMELNAIIRFQLMKFMVICLLTGLIYSLLKIHLFILLHLIVLQKPVQICLFLHITEHSVYR